MSTHNAAINKRTETVVPAQSTAIAVDIEKSASWSVEYRFIIVIITEMSESHNSRPKSIVWQYFDATATTATCTICKKVFTRSNGNNTNMSGHLQRDQRKQFQALKETELWQKAEAEQENQAMLICYETFLLSISTLLYCVIIRRMRLCHSTLSVRPNKWA